jgi:class 3 adenylate cyclase
MSNLPGIAYELCGDSIGLVDLATASLQVTSRFRTLKATFFESDTEADGRKYRVFELPVRKVGLEDKRSLLHGNCDTTDVVNIVIGSFFYEDNDAQSVSVIHAASLDQANESVIHVFIFYKMLPSEIGGDGAKIFRGVSRGLVIWESATGSRYLSGLQALAGNAAFPGFVRAEGLSPQEHVSGFLLFKAFFERKMKSLTFVNNDLIDGAWRKMLKDGGHNSDLPWERNRIGQLDKRFGSEVGTVTLSLDLRKSTYMMRQAQDRASYAHWLEALAEIARDFTLRHRGIYDKFTGDGAISHFTYDMADADHSSRNDAISRAFKCAQDLIIASNLHLSNIELEFDYLSGKSGPAIGLAFGPAAWSLDRDGRPVVVGSGVVNACRLCGGPSGSIRTTINIKNVIETQHNALKFLEHHLDDHKDLLVSDDPICGQLGEGMQSIGTALNEIQARVSRIWSEVKVRHL